jgi:hypothetical protein
LKESKSKIPVIDEPHGSIPNREQADQKRLRIYLILLKVIAHKAVPDRPGRSEPRVRKRRPKAYPLMTKPRHELRKQLQTA